MYAKLPTVLTLLVALTGGSLFTDVFAQVANVELVSEFGERGQDPGQFFWPEKTAVDPAGTIIVADTSNDRIQLCNREGACTAFGGYGSQPGQFNSPVGIDLDVDGNLVIADSANNRIQVCDYQGHCRVYTDSSGNEPEINWPLDLAFDADGDLHILNADNYWICPANGGCFQAEDGSGNRISFGFARGLAIDPSNGVLVADMTAERILACQHGSPCTELLGFDAPFYLPLPPGAFSQPKDVSIDASGRIYIAEGRLQICKTAPVQCYIIDGIFGTSVTIGSDGLIYVTDTNTHKVVVARLLELSSKFPINPGLNGPWYDLQSPGQGFFVNVFPETNEMFVGWFTYDLEPPMIAGSAVLGDPGHRWLTAQGHYREDTAQLQIFLTEGGRFLSDTPVAESSPTGEMIITFKDCNEAWLEFELDSNSGKVTGNIDLTRISDENVAICEQLAAKSYAY